MWTVKASNLEDVAKQCLKGAENGCSKEKKERMNVLIANMNSVMQANHDKLMTESEQAKRSEEKILLSANDAM